MGWTDDRTATLKKLWLGGLSATQIAKQLGGFEHCDDGGRSAVCGKLMRVGMSRRSKPSEPKPATPKTPRTIAMNRVAPPPQERTTTSVPIPAPVHRIENPGSATSLSLGKHMCKWPIGDPLAEGFSFCGRRTDTTYCREHAQVAYQQPQTARKPRAHEESRINF